MRIAKLIIYMWFSGTIGYVFGSYQGSPDLRAYLIASASMLIVLVFLTFVVVLDSVLANREISEKKEEVPS